MNGYWHNPVVCLSVCLSVCDAVHCGSQGWCTGLKVVPACTSRASSFCLFKRCCIGIGCVTKLPKKNESRIRENVFVETQITTRALVHSALITVDNLRRSTSRTLLVTFERIKFGCVQKLYTYKNRIVYQPFVAIFSSSVLQFSTQQWAWPFTARV